jgi:hypothetical protein
MYEQLRPPTDNLYKFVALSGLAVAVFAAYMDVTTDIKLATLYWQSNDAYDAVEHFKDRYDDDIWSVTYDLNHKLINADTAAARKTAAAAKRDASIAKYQKEYSEARAARRKLHLETFYQYWILVVVGAIGLMVSFLGFILWYLMLQRPLDEIMRYDLHERRLKASEAAKT